MDDSRLNDNDQGPHRGKRPPNRRRRGIRRRLLAPRFLFGVATVFAVLGGIGVIAAIIVLLPCKNKAATFDLAEIRKVETASVVYDRNGEVLGSLFTENRRPIPINQLPATLVNAVIAAEDSRFFAHRGIDFAGVIRAAITNILQQRIAQGASTITQQLARQTFGMREISYKRKFTEMFLARGIEEQYSKTEILQHYLNLIYFGNGFYGIESAALGYFGKPASELSLGEGAVLAALIKRPAAYNPFKSIELTTGARNRTLERMRSLDYITGEEYEAAIAEPVTPLAPSLRSGKGLHVMGEIRRRLDEIFEKRIESREGIQVYTSIDATLERTVRRSVSERLAAIEKAGPFPPGQGSPEKERQPLEAAVVLISNDTGELLASVGGRNFGRSEFDRAFNARRMMGTAFTPFIYAAAVEGGVDPYAEVLDAPLDNREVMIGALEGIVGEWGAEDFDNKYEGRISAWKAIVSSKNAATVRLGRKLRADRVPGLLRRAGFTGLKVAPSTILGQTEVTPAELTLAYSVFANGGRRPERIRIIRRVVDEKGRIIHEDTGGSKQLEVMTPASAGHVHSALAAALEKGTGETSVSELGLIHMPAGGKTGTAYNFTDAWFVGYTSAVTCGVWVGHDRPETIGEGAFGSVLALPVWVDAMNAAFESHSPDQIEPPPGTGRVFVCDYTGMAETPYCTEPRVVPRISDKPIFVRCSHRAYLPTSRIARLQPCTRHTAADLPEGAKVMTERDARTTRDAAAGLFARPVYPLTATLMGDDPFGTLVPPAAPNAENPPASGSPDILRAEPVKPEQDPARAWRWRW